MTLLPPSPRSNTIIAPLRTALLLLLPLLPLPPLTAAGSRSGCVKLASSVCRAARSAALPPTHARRRLSTCLLGVVCGVVVGVKQQMLADESLL